MFQLICWNYQKIPTNATIVSSDSTYDLRGVASHSNYLQLLGAFAKLRKTTLSFPMTVCPFSWNNSAPTRRILMKIYVWAFFENLLRKFKFQSYPTRIMGTSHEHVFTFMTIYRQTLLRMRNVLEKSCRKNQNTHFMFNNVFPKITPFIR
jgi:hypothetical protein